MRNFIKLFGIFIFVLNTTNVIASDASTANGNASVKVRKALSIAETTEMDFSTVTLGTGAGTVEVAENGALTASNGYTTLGTGSAGIFDILGSSNQLLSVAYTNGILKSSISSLTQIPVSVSGVNNVTTNDAGAALLTVTGVLSFNGTEADADYSTSFGTPYTVTISY